MAIQINKGDNLGNEQLRVGRTQLNGNDGGIGRAIAGLGNPLLALKAELDKNKETTNEINIRNAVLARKKQIDGIKNDLSKDIDAGTITANDSMEEFNKRVSALPKYELDGANREQTEKLNYFYNVTDYEGQQFAYGLYAQGIKKEAQTSINTSVRLMNEDSKTPIEEQLKLIDTPEMQKGIMLGWGATDAKEVTAKIKRDLLLSNLNNKLIQASDAGDYKTLKTMQAEVKKSDFFGNILQNDDRVKLGHLANVNMKRMESEWKAAQAESLVNLQYKMQDDSAKIEAGLDVSDPLTEDQIRASRPSNPVSRERFDRQIQSYRETLQLQPVLADVVRGTPEEALTAINSIKPNADDENFSLKQQRYNFVMSRYQQTLQAREKDPAGWLVQNNESVQKAFQAYTEDSTNGVAFATAVEAQKQRYGIKNNDILPKSIAENILNRIENGKDSSIFDAQDLSRQFGYFTPKIIAQIQKKGSATTKVITAMEDQGAMVKLQRIRNIPTNELSKTFSKTSKESVDSAVQNALIPAFDTFIRQGGAGYNTINDVAEVTTRLAYQYVNEGLSEKAAATKAYKATMGDLYTFNDTWRLPNRLNLDSYDIYDGAKKYLSDLKENDINEYVAYGDPRISGEINRRNALQAVKNDGVWITNKDETGLLLTRNGLAVVGKDNQPIQVPFNKLAEVGMNNRGYGNRARKYLGSSSTFEAKKMTQEEIDMLNQQNNNLSFF